MSRKKHAKTRDEDETRNIQSSNSPFPLGSVRKSTHWEQLLYTFRCGTVGSMKSKTSITLSRDLLEDLDRIFGDSNNRSRVIETAVREYIKRHIRDVRDRQDLQLINENAASLNKEAKDAFSYQIKR